MENFIEVHNHIINVESISKLEFISDDIYLGDFPKDEKGKICVDWISFIFAKITLFSGETIDLTIDLYQPEEEQNEEEWYRKNRAIISMSWEKLRDSLGEIIQITEYEYKY